jgi:hypothetical protein
MVTVLIFLFLVSSIAGVFYLLKFFRNIIIHIPAKIEFGLMLLFIMIALIAFTLLGLIGTRPKSQPWTEVTEIVDDTTAAKISPELVPEGSLPRTIDKVPEATETIAAPEETIQASVESEKKQSPAARPDRPTPDTEQALSLRDFNRWHEQYLSRAPVFVDELAPVEIEADRLTIRVYLTTADPPMVINAGTDAAYNLLRTFGADYRIQLLLNFENRDIATIDWNETSRRFECAFTE